MRRTRRSLLPTLFSALTLAAGAARADVVLRGEQSVEVAPAEPGADLWVSPEDLQRISGFVLKPQGACLEQICVPLAQDRDSDLLVRRGDTRHVNASGLARRLEQPVVADAAAHVWSFGDVPATRRAFAAGQAPDFALADRTGRTIRLSELRGRKVLILTWASWCKCREDLPAWQALYEELHPQGLEVISAAEDAEGEPAAGPLFAGAHVTFPSIVDVNHTITALFDLVNVPTAIWINEQGRIVRRDDGAYPGQRRIVGVTVGAAGYLDALRDWVARGDASPYALNPERIAAELAARGPDVALAKVNFRLGSYFYQQGDKQRATQYWEVAESLDPDNWNYRRQEWSDSIFEKDFKMLGRALSRAVRGVPYYKPIELPPAEPPAPH